MQLQAESNPALNTVTAYGESFIEINAVAYRHAVYFAPEGAVNTWKVGTIADINGAMLQEIAGVKKHKVDPLDFLDGRSGLTKPDGAPEVLLIGTGHKQHFLPSHLTQPLLDIGIGVESMSTYAAARTYNILMAEGRRVIAALLPLEQK
ncbi:MAG: hypothetical protein H5U29_04005 [Pusillimonas sp.]|nr:hypothetical protein [Pusillimonas sp.]